MYGINENYLQFNEHDLKDKLKKGIYDIIDDYSEEDLYFLMVILYYINNQEINDLHNFIERL